MASAALSWLVVPSWSSRGSWVSARSDGGHSMAVRWASAWARNDDKDLGRGVVQCAHLEVHIGRIGVP